MEVTERQRRLLALCAIRVGDRSVDWSLIAREALKPGGLEELESARLTEKSVSASDGQRILKAGLKQQTEWLQRVDDELAAAEAVGAELVTVLDKEYPINLRLIFNLPPFLFYRGGPWRRADTKSVAVVGTRDASPRGLERARQLSERLVQEDVVVVSGMARGIDTAAHTATLDAGGRTIAVIGTGITKTYPAENKALCERIVEGGMVVSQFWPTSSPARWTFPRRNAVMSGIAQGTAVIEASSTSGAKMQARLALEHGKKVFLLKSLVTDQNWAQTYVNRRGAIEVDSVDDIIAQLSDPDRIQDVTASRQLAFELT